MNTEGAKKELTALYDAQLNGLATTTIIEPYCLYSPSEVEHAITLLDKSKSHCQNFHSASTRNVGLPYWKDLIVARLGPR